MNEQTVSTLDAAIVRLPMTQCYGPNTWGSATIEKLAAALSLMQGSMKAATKSAENPHFKSIYADLADCWDAARAHLNGLSVTQHVSADGKRVSVTTLLMHTSGQWLSSTLTIEARDASPQAVGSAITYGRRYGFNAAVGIAPKEDDDDGNSAQQRPTPMERDDMPFRPRDEPRAAGYNGSPEHMQRLGAELHRRRIDVSLFDDISRAMLGKSMADLERVIKEVMNG